MGQVLADAKGSTGPLIELLSSKMAFDHLDLSNHIFYFKFYDITKKKKSYFSSSILLNYLKCMMLINITEIDQI